MDKTVRKLASFEAVKEDEYRYWQSVPPVERIAAAWEMSIEQYRQSGVDHRGRALRTTVARFERPLRTEAARTHKPA
jgi:hypothetical protein